MRSWGLGLIVLALCNACGAARQQLLGEPVREQVAILVSTSDEVNAADEAGGVATLAETVSNDLKELGIDSQIYASRYDHPKPPLIRLDVRYWRDPGTKWAKIAALSLVVPIFAVAGIGTGGNRIIVDCSLYMPRRDKRVFFHHYDRFGIGGFVTQTDGTSSAASAGSAIVRDITNSD